MGGLAHYIEEGVVATTQISLIRMHSEKILPPRVLWVPFELSQPLSQPKNAAFQTRVLRACFELLDAVSSPVLEDYPEDVPVEARIEDITGMAYPISLPVLPLDDSEATATLLAEVGRMQ